MPLSKSVVVDDAAAWATPRNDHLPRTQGYVNMMGEHCQRDCQGRRTILAFFPLLRLRRVHLAYLASQEMKESHSLKMPWE